MQATRRYSTRFAEMDARVCGLGADANDMAGGGFDDRYWIVRWKRIHVSSIKPTEYKKLPKQLAQQLKLD